jgi:hypothetical protein
MNSQTFMQFKKTFKMRITQLFVLCHVWVARKNNGKLKYS